MRVNQLKEESPRHLQAFEVYYGLGAKRTYRDAAKQLGLSASALKLMARSFAWSARIAEREATVARQAADQVIQSAISDSARKRRIVDMALVKVAKAINADKVKVQVADLDRLLRLQHFLDGGKAELSLEMLRGKPVLEVFEFFMEWYRNIPADERQVFIEVMRKRKENRFDNYRSLPPPADPKVE